MRRFSKVILTGLLAGGLAGCSNFLSSDQAAQDPNNPSKAFIGQLFTAIQTATFAQQEGIVPLIACMWMQQCTGTSNFLATLEKYNITSEDTPSPAFSAIYEAGGLVDIRTVERLADSVGDKQWKGIAEVYEAITMTMAADVWGDVPYRQAINASVNPKPTLDPQLQVYSDVLALLDQAITDLAGAGPGPVRADLVFKGDVAKWTAVAHTLKARIHLHLVEKNGNAEYQSAITEATAGINDASGKGDFTAIHGQNPQEDNIWFQFNTRSGFGQFLVAGRFLADVLVARNDPRAAEYFAASTPGPFGGQDPQGGTSAGGVSLLEGTRNAPGFSQPFITYDENQLILAEANFVLNGAGAAQLFVDAVRTKAGISTPKTVATLNDVMEEKYIALYQNYEVWNDYKRTCYPQITPFATTTFANQIPGRLFYGTTETAANPHNVPERSEQLQIGGSKVSGGIAGFRNPNDPSPCP
jgi:hypothetical protein